MKVYTLTIFIAVLALSMSVAASYKETGESCEACHSRETQGMVKVWKSSAHVERGLECVDCHGDDYEKNHRTDGKRRTVDASVCARCHSAAAKEHFAGKHGIGFRAGRACTRNLRPTPEIKAGCNDCHEQGSALPRQNAECARFLEQTPEMQRQGCLSCHKIEVRCDSCHSAHDTDLEIVRNPAVCGTCHMGPDHPQYEMWESSKHGILYTMKGQGYAPDCGTCHMPEGTHNVSTGISMGLAGQKYDEDIRKTEREKMLKVCSRCHSKSFAARNLEDGDAIQKQARALINEAASIIKELDKEGLLLPSPSERPAHPLAGRELEIGSQMLYEDLSDLEAIYFRMKKFYYVITYKGVFHQNPDYAHWYGNAPLKLALSEIRSGAMVLRQVKLLQERVDNLLNMGLEEKNPGVSPNERLKDELRQLRERYLKGDLDEKEFKRRKNELLDTHGL